MACIMERSRVELHILGGGAGAEDRRLAGRARGAKGGHVNEVTTDFEASQSVRIGTESYNSTPIETEDGK